MLAGLLNIVQRGKKKNYPILNYILSQKTSQSEKKDQQKRKNVMLGIVCLRIFVALNLFSNFDVGWPLKHRTKRQKEKLANIKLYT